VPGRDVSILVVTEPVIPHRDRTSRKNDARISEIKPMLNKLHRTLRRIDADIH
jgi:hypothetical protein